MIIDDLSFSPLIFERIDMVAVQEAPSPFVAGFAGPSSNRGAGLLVAIRNCAWDR